MVSNTHMQRGRALRIAVKILALVIVMTAYTGVVGAQITPQQKPVFIYPADGATLDYEGSYLFKVEPIAGVQEFLWGFFQNGEMVWENFRDEGTLSSNEYGINPGTTAHSKFIPGNVEVWVRALIDGQWTDAAIITIYLQSTTPTPTPTPTPTVTKGIGEIYGSVYDDFNNNGKRDPDGEKGEPGLADWTIGLKVNGVFIATTKTDMNGNYIFKNLPEGEYNVEEIVNNRWERTAPENGFYTVTISKEHRTEIYKDFGNLLIADQVQTPNTFYAGIMWNSDDTDVPQQAWALDASLRMSYADTYTTNRVGFPSYNGALGMYDVYVGFHDICTPKNYICNPEGNGNYKIAFGHSGGTQTLIDKLERGGVTADYAVFIAPALINEAQVDNLVKNGQVRKKVIIVQSKEDALYNFKARFENNHKFTVPEVRYGPLVTLLKIPRGDIIDIFGLVAVIVEHPIDKFLSANGIEPSWLPEYEEFWVGGADADRTKRTPFWSTNNVIVVDMDNDLKHLNNRWDVHHQLLVETIERFQNGIYPFNGSIDGLKKVG